MLNGESDFITALSSELIDKLRSGELIALAVLSDNTLTLDGVDYDIPPFADIMPFGEYYGVVLPKDSPDSVISAFDDIWEGSVESESFNVFIRENGLVRLNYSRSESAELTAKTASLLCWMLYNTGTVNVSPETVGISQPR